MNKSAVNTLQLANFRDLPQYKQNINTLDNKDNTISLVGADSFGQWRTAYKWDGVTVLESLDTPDPHKAICTLPKNWKYCYIVFNYDGNNARNSNCTNCCLLTQKNLRQSEIGRSTAFVVGDDNILRGYSVSNWSYCLYVYYLV